MTQINLKLIKYLFVAFVGHPLSDRNCCQTSRLGANDSTGQLAIGRILQNVLRNLGRFARTSIAGYQYDLAKIKLDRLVSFIIIAITLKLKYQKFSVIFLWMSIEDFVVDNS
jgi:hypothetical protein